MKKFKVGIIGCGGIANGKHMPTLTQLENVEMVAFCDIDVEKAKAAKEKFGTEDAKIYSDYTELLADDTIDVVHVLTPNNMHSPISCDAMRAGKDVLCEKPMAKTAAQAAEMVKVAKETGRTLSIGYQNRRSREAICLKKMCDHGELGEIYYAKAHAIRRRAVPTWGVFLDAEAQGGGPLIDIGTHALDLTLWCMNNYEPEMVVGSSYRKLADQTDQGNAFGDWNTDDFTTEDSAFGFIKMKNGATIVLESSWALNTLDIGEAKTTLCGTKAGATTKGGLHINGVVNNMLYDNKISDASGGVDFFDSISDNAPLVEAEIFYKALENGDRDGGVLPEQAFVVTQILEAIYESAKTGKPVYFD